MPSTVTRPMGVRLSHRAIDDLTLIAATTGQSAGAVVRGVIESHLADLRSRGAIRAQ